MRSGIVLFSLLALAGLAAAHGSPFDPPPPPEHKRPPPPPPPPPPPTLDPEEPVPPPEDPGSIPGTPAPDPGRGAPDPQVPMPPRGDVRTKRPRRSVQDDSWRLWWEYNREHLLGLRDLLCRPGTVTPGAAPATDPLAERRDAVLAALRRAARHDPERLVRAGALIAIGRMGDASDAPMLLAVLKDDRQPHETREGAAVALGLLACDDEEIARSVRGYLEYVVQNRGALPDRAWGLTVAAAGLRARTDPALRMALLGRAAGRLGDGEEAADLALACGLAGDPMVAPELVRAARQGALGGQRLSDVERAHAAAALGLLGDGAVIEPLVAVLGSRRARIDTRRGAALALGRLMRETEPDEDAWKRARKALRLAVEKDGDALLRGYAALALGAARRPDGLPLLREAVDHGGNASVKPYCALALGLAARTLGDDDEARRIRTFLAGEMEKTNESELGSALSLALGLARAEDAREALLDRVGDGSLPAAARGAAAQGLGLLGSAPKATVEALLEAARAESDPVALQDIVLALGLLGQRSVAKDLVDMLKESSRSQVQGRLMLALAYLNHSAAIEPLLAQLEDRTNRGLVREFAAVALGLLGDRRTGDPLFRIDAWFNVHATTRASNELIRLY